MSILDDEGERVGTSGAGETSSCQVGTNQEPYKGMLFDSEESAKAFYDEYANRVGFLTRVLSSRKSERDGSIISRGLGCRGGSNNKKAERVENLKRDRRREGCTAMILVKREMPGRWVVRKFVRDHNHPLVVQLQKNRPAPDEKDKKIQELTAELRVKKRLSAAYREQLLKFMIDVEDHNENLSTKVQVVRDKLKELEAKWQVCKDDYLPAGFNFEVYQTRSIAFMLSNFSDQNGKKDTEGLNHLRSHRNFLRKCILLVSKLNKKLWFSCYLS